MQLSRDDNKPLQRSHRIPVKQPVFQWKVRLKFRWLEMQMKGELIGHLSPYFPGVVAFIAFNSRAEQENGEKWMFQNEIKPFT